MTTLSHLTCEYRSNPIGIDVTAPRFGWRMESSRQGARQTAYRLRTGPSIADLQTTPAWDTGRINSDESIHVVYTGPKLQSRQRVYWQVTIWDESGAEIVGEPAFFEIGLLKKTDWKARWIGSDLRGGPRSPVPAPHMRRTFEIDGDIASARLYVTALGVYECAINGRAVSEDVFAPGWTNYAKRIQYNTYDVTGLLNRGKNVVSALLGDGWAVGRIGWGARQQYTEQPKFLAQLEITLADGRTMIVGSDGKWKHTFGATLDNDFLMGEAYDARLELGDWQSTTYDDRSWRAVTIFEEPSGRLTATNGPTVQRIQEITPITEPDVKRSFSGSTAVFDLGQNMVGRIRFRGSAPAGTTVTLRYAEVLNPDGSVYTTNLRSARVTDYYTFKGEGVEEWEPRFTFHGFRYVEVANYPGDLTRDSVTGIVLHSAMEQTGRFECSDPEINQLQSNILWGQKGNFLDVPTDCPQRDERLGWTGDIQAFISTAVFNMNVSGFMAKWLRDVADAQNEHGHIPAVVPNQPPLLPDGGPAWSDAAVICPWTLYLAYGDTRILEDNYAVMTRFMESLAAAAPNHIRCAFDFAGWPGFGDWLSINAPTPRDLIGTAFYAYDALLMSRIADVLGRRRDAAAYRRLFNEIKIAFSDRYLVGGAGVPADEKMTPMRAQMEGALSSSDGNLAKVDYGAVESQIFNTAVVQPSQTAYVLALHFDLLPRRLRAAAADELVQDIERRGIHLSTGFVGAPYLPHALSDAGKTTTTYALLNQRTWPSWLYSVTKGATTIWERWDGWTEERGFQDPSMNSYNHYAYGSIGAWMYRVIAGIEIDPAQPGYKHTVLRPQPGGGLSHASASLDTAYGELASAWRFADGAWTWTIVVPPNTTATAWVPAVGESITLNDAAVSGAEHHLGSGRHVFVVR
jgi:alpha-L-rhamnosidase